MSQLLARRYRLGRALGAGGMARVYEATDTTLGRRVAVKVLDAEAARTADPAGRERFLREARSLAAFAHPNVVTLFDAGEDDGMLYLVMEYVTGGNLAEVIARDAPLPPQVAASIGADVLAGLQAAHDAGLVHRDVKPANVLVTEAGVAKLADFGIAKQLDDLAESLTATGMVVGTRHYVAPEQVAGADATPAGDVYAVGVLLHELLTGRRPGPGSTLESAAPPGLRDAVERALAPDPANRFASAADMARHLGRDLDPTRLHLSTPGAAAPAPTEIGPRTLLYGDAAGHPGPNGATRAAAPAPEPPSTSDRSRRWWPVVAALAVGAVLLWAAVLRAGREDVTSTPAEPTGLAEITAAPTSARPTTAAPTPTTDSPPSTTAPELVAGFAAPADLASFIAELESERDVAGKQAKKLAEQLEELAERSARLSRGDDDASAADELRDEAEELGEDIEGWVEKGDLRPEIAGVAIELIDELVRTTFG